jgi:hypothetical protein
MGLVCECNNILIEKNPTPSLTLNIQSDYSPVRLGTETQITQMTCHTVGDISVSMSSYMKGHSSRPMVGQTQGSSDLRLFLFAPHSTASPWHVAARLERNLLWLHLPIFFKTDEVRLCLGIVKVVCACANLRVLLCCACALSRLACRFNAVTQLTDALVDRSVGEIAHGLLFAQEHTGTCGRLARGRRHSLHLRGEGALYHSPLCGPQSYHTCLQPIF